jgi:hypothetical protein
MGAEVNNKQWPFVDPYASERNGPNELTKLWQKYKPAVTDYVNDLNAKAGEHNALLQKAVDEAQAGEGYGAASQELARRLSDAYIPGGVAVEKLLAGALQKLTAGLELSIPEAEAVQAARQAAPETNILQAMYRGYAGEPEASTASQFFLTPHQKVADYYAKKRALQTGRDPHVDQVLVDPLNAGEVYGHSTMAMPELGYPKSMYTPARRGVTPEQILSRKQLYADGGRVNDKQHFIDPYASERNGPNELTKQFPRLSGFLESAILGTEPQDMGSVLDPLTAPRRAGADYGYPIGQATQIYPLVGPIAKFAKGVAMAPGLRIGSAAAQRGIMKHPGGQWLAKDSPTEYINSSLLGQWEAEAAHPAHINNELLGAVEVPAEELTRAATDDWLKSTLNKYMTNKMGTIDDPVRISIDKKVADLNKAKTKTMKEPHALAKHAEALKAAGPKPDMPPGTWEDAISSAERQSLQKYAQAEDDYNEGLKYVAHTDIRDWPVYSQGENFLKLKRGWAGMPLENAAVSEEGKTWENLIDTTLESKPSRDRLDPLFSNPKRVNDLVEENPWLLKVPPETQVSALNPTMVPALDFEVIADNLMLSLNPESNLPASLKLTPAQVKNMSMEAAVGHTAAINKYKDALATVKRATIADRIPVRKEYPEGYKWRSIPDTSKDLEALKYAVDTGCEGDWCTKGEFAAKTYGAGVNQIHQLVDSKGNPHVQIQTTKSSLADDVYDIPDELIEATAARFPIEAQRRNIDPIANAEDYRNMTREIYEEASNAYKASHSPRPSQTIKQIKGRGNQAVKTEHLPFVHDFVRSQNWEDVQDLGNAGLIKMRGNPMSDIPLEWSRDANMSDLVNRWGTLENPPAAGSYMTKEELRNLLMPPEGFAAGGLVKKFFGLLSGTKINPATAREAALVLGGPERQLTSEMMKQLLSKTAAQGGRKNTALSSIASIEGFPQGSITKSELRKYLEPPLIVKSVDAKRGPLIRSNRPQRSKELISDLDEVAYYTLRGGTKDGLKLFKVVAEDNDARPKTSWKKAYEAWMDGDSGSAMIGGDEWFHTGELNFEPEVMEDWIKRSGVVVKPPDRAYADYQRLDIPGVGIGKDEGYSESAVFAPSDTGLSLVSNRDGVGSKYKRLKDNTTGTYVSNQEDAGGHFSNFTPLSERSRMAGHFRATNSPEGYFVEEVQPDPMQMASKAGLFLNPQLQETPVNIGQAAIGAALRGNAPSVWFPTSENIGAVRDLSKNYSKLYDSTIPNNLLGPLAKRSGQSILESDGWRGLALPKDVSREWLVKGIPYAKGGIVGNHDQGGIVGYNPAHVDDTVTKLRAELQWPLN